MNPEPIVYAFPSNLHRITMWWLNRAGLPVRRSFYPKLCKLIFLFKDYFDFINTKFNCKFIGCAAVVAHNSGVRIRLTKRIRSILRFRLHSCVRLSQEATNTSTHAVPFTPFAWDGATDRIYYTLGQTFRTFFFIFAVEFRILRASSVSLTKISHRH